MIKEDLIDKLKKFSFDSLLENYQGILAEYDYSHEIMEEFKGLTVLTDDAVDEELKGLNNDTLKNVKIYNSFDVYCIFDYENNFEFISKSELYDRMKENKNLCKLIKYNYSKDIEFKYKNIKDDELWTEEEMKQYYLDFVRYGYYEEASYKEFVDIMLKNDFEKIKGE